MNKDTPLSQIIGFILGFGAAILYTIENAIRDGGLSANLAAAPTLLHEAIHFSFSIVGFALIAIGSGIVGAVVLYTTTEKILKPVISKSSG